MTLKEIVEELKSKGRIVYYPADINKIKEHNINKIKEHKRGDV